MYIEIFINGRNIGVNKNILIENLQFILLKTLYSLNLDSFYSKFT